MKRNRVLKYLGQDMRIVLDAVEENLPFVGERVDFTERFPSVTERKLTGSFKDFIHGVL